MAFPNVSDLIATTIQSRTKQIADNVSKNNALLNRLEKKGKIKTFSGGTSIYQELSFAENGNAGWYSGYDPLPIAAQDVLSASEFPIKQAAVPVTISGLEQLINAGKEKMIDLMDERMAVAETTMANLVSGALYSDGTGFGGRQLTGLNAAVPVANTSGTYGGIDRATWTFWRPKVIDTSGLTSSTITAQFNTLWAQLVRGVERPDLILVDNTVWLLYLASLQNVVRFTSTDSEANMGFPSVKYMNADVVLDGGIGGFCPAGTAFFINTNYMFYRPHAQRNMVPLSPNKRYAINQDAEVQILAFAGNMTCSGQQFQGRLDNN